MKKQKQWLTVALLLLAACSLMLSVAAAQFPQSVSAAGASNRTGESSGGLISDLESGMDALESDLFGKDTSDRVTDRGESDRATDRTTDRATDRTDGTSPVTGENDGMGGSGVALVIGICIAVIVLIIIFIILSRNGDRKK